MRTMPRNGGPLSRHQITRMINRIGKAAGIGHVHPHQLRHTLVTQAINRGMNLEAIAAMLGHKTLRMTLLYARVADRTVADAYDQGRTGLAGTPRQQPDVYLASERPRPHRSSK